MKFSPRFLEDIRERTVLSEIIGTTVRLTKRGQEYSGLCPFHKEKSPSFTVNDHKGVYYCFGCGATGDAIHFLQEKSGYSFLEAVQYLAQKQGIPLPQESHPAQDKQDNLYTQLYSLLQEVTLWFSEQLQTPAGQAARHYLTQRGLRPETISQFCIGFAPTGNHLYQTFCAKGYSPALLEKAGLIIIPDHAQPYDRFRNRLIFPIYDIKGRPVAFGGRVLDDTKPKYLNSPQTPIFNKSQTIYGLHLYKNKLRKGEITAKIVEGYMDVIALHQTGIYGALAPLGTAITPEHIKEVWRYCTDPVLCFDGDEAGERAADRTAQKAINLLKPGYSLYFTHLPRGEDPDSLIQSGQKKVLEGLLKNPTALIDKLWDIWVERHNYTTPEKLAKIQSDTFTMLQQIPSPLVRQLYQKEFRHRFFHLQRPQAKRQKQKSQGVSCAFNPEKQQLEILFAAILNHPYILHEVEEAFATLEISNWQLRQLREDIFFIFHEDSTLDTHDFQSQINMKGYHELLLKILCERVYLHAAFARPHTAKEKVLRGWNEIYALIVQKKELKNAIQESQQYIETDLSAQAWIRHKTLIEQRLKQTDFESD